VLPVFERFGRHRSLNRQAGPYARDGVPFSLGTLADHRQVPRGRMAPAESAQMRYRPTQEPEQQRGQKLRIDAG
jgi:hypothetical protein